MDNRHKMGLLARIRAATSVFFHAEQVPHGLAVVRILLPLVMMI